MSSQQAVIEPLLGFQTVGHLGSLSTYCFWRIERQVEVSTQGHWLVVAEYLGECDLAVDGMTKNQSLLAVMHSMMEARRRKAARTAGRRSGPTFSTDDSQSILYADRTLSSQHPFDRIANESHTTEFRPSHPFLNHTTHRSFEANVSCSERRENFPLYRGL